MNAKTTETESLDLRVLKWAGVAIAAFVAGSLITMGGFATAPRAVHAAHVTAVHQAANRPAAHDLKT